MREIGIRLCLCDRSGFNVFPHHRPESVKMNCHSYICGNISRCPEFHLGPRILTLMVAQQVKEPAHWPRVSSSKQSIT